MIKRLKNFYHKADFNYSAGFIDPFEYHKTFYLILKAFHVTDIENRKAKYFDQNVLIFIVGALGVIVTALSTYHGLHIFDISLIIESGTYVIILSYKLLIISSTKVNLLEYHSLLKAMKDDFLYICGPGYKYKKRFFENQLITWKGCIFTVVFTFGTALGIFATSCLALIYHLLTYTPSDKKNRPLLFPFWLNDVDFHQTPAYEIAFIFSCICTLSFGYNYICVMIRGSKVMFIEHWMPQVLVCKREFKNFTNIASNFSYELKDYTTPDVMIQTQIVWVRHIMSKADIIIWSIEDLYEGIHATTNDEESRIFSQILKDRMREIVVKHQNLYSLIEDYSKVFKKLLLYEQSLSGPTVCLTAYSAAEKLAKDELPVILILLCISTCVLYYIPNYLCTLLDIKVKSICDACWGIQFWNGGTMIRHHLVLVMQKSLRPLPLTEPGFRKISIETFSKKMSTAYSCFNMLRQANH